MTDVLSMYKDRANEQINRGNATLRAIDIINAANKCNLVWVSIGDVVTESDGVSYVVMAIKPYYDTFVISMNRVTVKSNTFTVHRDGFKLYTTKDVFNTNHRSVIRNCVYGVLDFLIDFFSTNREHVTSAFILKKMF
jgi:hypothetical protein